MAKPPSSSTARGREVWLVAMASTLVSFLFIGVLLYQHSAQRQSVLAGISSLQDLHAYLQRHSESGLPNADDVGSVARQLQAAIQAAAHVPVLEQEAEVLRQLVQSKEQGLQQMARTAADVAQQLQQARDGAAAKAKELHGQADLAGGAEATRFRALAVAGDSCGAVRGYEFSGSTLVVGSDHKAADAAECCAACHAHRRAVARGGTGDGVNGTACNLWAFCGDADKCGSRLGECWLKAAAALPAPPELPPRAEASPGWTSGAVYEADQELEQYNDTALVLHTAHGDVEVALLPELAPASVREIRRMAALLAPAGGVCSNCRIYRAEKDFLVGGLMQTPGGYVETPRHPNPPQKTTMERGLVCWAGGGGGPHWFVNLVDQSRFKDDHLCFGKVSASDMSVFDKIVTLPVRDKASPAEVTLLTYLVAFNVSLRAVAAPAATVPAAKTAAAPAVAPEAASAGASNPGAAAAPVAAPAGQEAATVGAVEPRGVGGGTAGA